MSRTRLFLALVAGGAIAVALFVETRPSPSTSPPHPAPADHAVAVTPPAPAAASRTAASDPAALQGAPAGPDLLATLPPEDAEWVLEEVARTEQARALSAQEQRELTAQLASVRMHEVLERTEPLSVEPEGAQ